MDAKQSAFSSRMWTVLRFVPAFCVALLVGGCSSPVGVSNETGYEIRRLTDDLGDDEHPSWSPDGHSIAFTSDRDGTNGDIYVMDADGGNVRRLTSHNDWDFAPSWSPDSRSVVFYSNRGDNRDVYVIEVFGRSNRGRRP